MKKLIIIGAGGFGREVLQYALDIKEAGAADWEIAGFLDDNIKALDGYSCEYGIVGTVVEHKITGEHVYICAIGDPKTKLGICRRFLNEDAEFINVVHPKAYVARNCKMGFGVVLCPNSSVTTNVAIGSFVAIDVNSICSHDVKIGDGCTISHFCDLTGFSVLGEGVFLGSHAVVCPSVKVGDYAKLGAGAVAIRDVGAHATVVGVPAKKIHSAQAEAGVSEGQKCR
ncbi:MAG: NeuD/PglB/VioB family sugar acetyltransferase [Clostridiales bacterium]|nr:NeuD/PglB/VioB family sugar acetyltransferase [Clostridiales bacterium]